MSVRSISNRSRAAVISPRSVLSSVPIRRIYSFDLGSAGLSEILVIKRAVWIRKPSNLPKTKWKCKKWSTVNDSPHMRILPFFPRTNKMRVLRQSVDFILRTEQEDRATPLLLPVYHHVQIRIGQVPEQKPPRFRAGGFHGQVAVSHRDRRSVFRAGCTAGDRKCIRYTWQKVPRML